MKSYYITPKVILLFIFGLLVFIRGITADDKTPPSTLQIGLPPPEMQLLIVGVKHRVPKEECRNTVDQSLNRLDVKRPVPLKKP